MRLLYQPRFKKNLRQALIRNFWVYFKIIKFLPQVFFRKYFKLVSVLVFLLTADVEFRINAEKFS